MARNAQTAHGETEALLPWYVTGRLDEADQVLVEAHLESCADCRGQLETERRLASAWRGFAPERSDGLSRLRARIENLPRPQAASRRFSSRQSLVRSGWASAAAILLVLLVAASLYATSLTSPDYRALGQQTSASADLIVLFRPETSEADMRRALRASGATLVGGPTSSDAYLLHVEPRGRDAALAYLHANDDVLMVEPMGGAPR